MFRLKRFFYWGFVILSLLACGACSGFGEATLPTLIPQDQIPTVVALTVEAAIDATPPTEETAAPQVIIAIRTPTIPLTPYPTQKSLSMPTGVEVTWPQDTLTITAIASLTPTVTDTPRPNFPLGKIRFLDPAPLSKVVSPILVKAVALAGPDGIFRLELLGEDGRLIARKVMSVNPFRQVNLATQLEYAIPLVAETGRLQLVTLDEFGRIIALNSVEVILLSVGPPDYLYSIDLLEHVLVENPAEGVVIEGGTVIVSGYARPTLEKPLLIELISEDGAVVGNRLVAVEPFPGEGYGMFVAEVAYTVSQPTRVRLTISERDARVPGPTYVTSRVITLSP